MLHEEPLCRDPYGEHVGRPTVANHVDHITPKRRGGTDVRSNLQSLCHSCHSRKTALEDGRWGD